MKKSTKSEKPAAPQAKSSKKSVETAAAKKTVAPKKVARTKPATAAPAPLATAPVTPAPAQPVNTPAPAPAAPVTPVTTSTTIVARYDAGFGNQLFVRGEGPGLSWDAGKPMTCIADDQWSYVVKGAEQPVVFKFLVNDSTWSQGEDFRVAPGASVVLSPSF